MKNFIDHHKNKLFKSSFHKLDFEFSKLKEDIYKYSSLAYLADFGAVDISFDLEILNIVNNAFIKTANSFKDVENKIIERPLIFVSIENSKFSNLDFDNLIDTAKSLNDNLVDVLEIEIDYIDIDCIYEQLSFFYSNLKKNFLSLKISRKNLSNANIIEIIKKARKITDNNLLIEVDGINNQSENTYNQTLQTISTADIINKELNSKIPNSKKIPIILSGGTNSFTSKLAMQCGVPFNGISITSNYLNQNKEFEIGNKDIFNSKELLDEFLKNLGKIFIF